ncbi:hypothetical protein PLCT1_01273 [Planctomycetaceae bacterium]|nr:hypothetical protein PLCT1_01273 [Planctomycetaceae bacterium]
MSNSFYRRITPEQRKQIDFRGLVYTLSEQTVRRLFEKKGGIANEVALKTIEIALRNGLKCREEEERKLIANPGAMREKGERPYVTMSENRLYIRELRQQQLLVEALMEKCREEVRFALDHFKPENETDLRIALDSVLGGEIGPLMAEHQGALREEIEEDEVKKVFKQLPLELQERLVKALQNNDEAALMAIFHDLPENLRGPASSVFKIAV